MKLHNFYNTCIVPAIHLSTTQKCQFTCPSYHFFFHRLACLLNNSYSLLKMEWSRTEKQSKKRELDYFLWTTGTDRTAVLYCTRNEVTEHEKWSALYIRRAISQNHKRYVPTLAAMMTYIQYLEGIDMWTSGGATYASRNTSGARRRRNTFGCFKTYFIPLYYVIKHLIFDYKFLTIPKQQRRKITGSTMV